MNRAIPSVLIAATLAAAAPTASANVGVSASCDRADVALTGWRAAPVTITLDVTVNGVPVLSGPHRFTGPDATVHVPLVVAGAATVAVRAQGSGRPFTASVAVNCPTPTPTPTPPAAPPPATPTPPPAPPVAPPRPPLTCADLAARGAGVRWLDQFGCTEPQRPRLTCADIPKGAGRAWFNGSRLGFRCPLPPRLQRPRVNLPAVAG